MTLAELIASEARGMSEKALQTWVINAARRAGWRHYHTYDSRRSAHGFPDLVLVWSGPEERRPARSLIVAELKTEKGTLTDHQRAWGDDLEQHVASLPGSPVRYCVWRPTDRLNGTIAAILAGDDV